MTDKETDKEEQKRLILTIAAAAAGGACLPVTVRAMPRHLSQRPDRPTRAPLLVVTVIMLLPSNQLCD